ncbi:hypothetical protein HC928_00635 [bacterium]|nr:hypothetical protein [bacterium]
MPLITLADGRKVDPLTGEVSGENVLAPATSDERPHVIATRLESGHKAITELPDKPERLNLVNVVLVYNLFGLTDADIAHILNLSPTQVAQIIDSEVATKLRETILNAIREHDTSIVRKKLSEYEERAAAAVGALLAAESPSVRLSAAKDILDRSGHRPVDIVEHRHKIDGGLVIEVIKKGDSSNIPPFTIEGEVVHGNG